MHTSQCLDLIANYRERFNMITRNKKKQLLLKTHHLVYSQRVHH